MYISMDTLINKTNVQEHGSNIKGIHIGGPIQFGVPAEPLIRRMSEEKCVGLHHHHHHHHHPPLPPPPPHHPSPSGDLVPSLWKERTDVWWGSRKTWCSAFIFDLSDWWNQTTGGFVLVDLVGHVSAHGLDLNVPWVGIFWFICKPFLFWRGGQGGRRRRGGRRKRKKEQLVWIKFATWDYIQPQGLSLSDTCAGHSWEYMSSSLRLFWCI